MTPACPAIVTARREADLIRAILMYLRTVPGVVAFRVNSGAVVGEYKGRRRFVRFNTMPGMSDIVGWKQEHVAIGARHMTPHGPEYGPDYERVDRAVFLAIEAKMPGKKPTREQQSFLNMVRKAGGIAILAYSVDDVIKEIR